MLAGDLVEVGIMGIRMRRQMRQRRVSRLGELQRMAAPVGRNPEPLDQPVPLEDRAALG